MTNKYPEAFFFNTLEKANRKNMLIAISCNKKASDIITIECAKNIIEQAANFTSGHLGLFIADEIMKYNEIAANRSLKKALDIAMTYGDHFFDLFNDAINEVDSCIRDRTSILRFADVANNAHQRGVEKVQQLYMENQNLKTETDRAAVQLLKWRCSDFAPNEKRIGAILDFIFREIPIVGAWDDINVKGIPYHGLIYPAINPRGMGIIANVVSEFDTILGSAERLLLVMHITDEGVLEIEQQAVEAVVS